MSDNSKIRKTRFANANLQLGNVHILPPRPGACPICATKHDPAMPHNCDSLYYQMKFRQKHGRFPTWKDAAAHCAPEMKKRFAEEYARHGVTIDLFGEESDGQPQ